MSRGSLQASRKNHLPWVGGIASLWDVSHYKDTLSPGEFLLSSATGDPGAK